jgi:hypothetical protein
MKVFLIEDERPTVEFQPADLDSDRVTMRLTQQAVEIGWAEVQQMAEGRLEIDMTIVGSYEIETNYLPDLTRYKGSIPTSLRKD